MRIRFTPSGLSTPSRARKVTRKNAPGSLLRPTRPSRGSRILDLKPAESHNESVRQVDCDPVPGHNHPIHNSALRSEWRHHMYSTGVFATGLGRTGSAYATLKLYSHGPIDESSYTPSHHQSFRGLFQADTQLLSGSVWSTCYYLYLVALRGLRSKEHTRDAHSQIFSHPAHSLRSLEFQPGKRLPGSSRVWNLFCRLGKSADGHSVLSRPWLSFQSSPGRISNWCSVKANGPAPPDMNLFLVLAGSLKANRHQNVEFSPPPGHASGSALQSIADDLATQSVCAVIGKAPFASTGAVMSAIRQRLLSYLPSSSIAAALDLHHIGITLQFGAAKKRLVQNILLNSDGSVKIDMDMPLSLPTVESTSAIEYTPEKLHCQSDLKMPADLTRQADLKMPAASEPLSLDAAQQEGQISMKHEKQEKLYNFSDSSRKKLGIGIRWVVNPQGRAPSVSHQRLSMRKVDYYCQASDARGLAALVNAASRMHKEWSIEPGLNLSASFKHFPSSASANSTMSSAGLDDVRGWNDILTWNKGRGALRLQQNSQQPSTQIGLHLPGILGAHASLANGARDVHFLITLCARSSCEDIATVDGDDSSDINEEISYLREAADMIVSRVLQATTFESLRTCAETTAKATLRFIKFLSGNLSLHEVKIRAITASAPGQSSSITTAASFVPGSSSAASSGPYSRKVQHKTELTYTQHAVTGKPIRSDVAPQSNQNPGKLSNDVVSGAYQGELHDASAAESDVADPEKVAKHGVDQSDEKMGTADGESESVADIPRLREALSADSGTNTNSMTGQANPAEKAQRKSCIETNVVAGVPCTAFYTPWVTSSPISQQTGLSAFRCRANWTPRHAPTLASTSPMAIERLVTRTVLQSGMSGLQDIYATALQVKAAMPCDPSSIQLSFRHPIVDENSIYSTANPFVETTINLRNGQGIEMTNEHWNQMPQTFEIVLPDLVFETINIGSPSDLFEDGPISLSVVLRADSACQTSAGMLAQAKHLSEIVRGIIRPVLTGSVMSCLDDFVGQCSRAILRNEAPLAGLLCVSLVEVQARKLMTKGKRQSQGRAARAIASAPGAVVHPRLKKYIAIGSNVGDRIEALESACQILNQDVDIHIAETSPLYETEPMYVEDQDRFLNGVCEVITDLTPTELLDRLQAIENGLGRHKTIDKGPRNIDLDILTYGQRTVSTDRLIVPHALMLEREFVLRPMCDTRGYSWRHPSTGQKAETHRLRLPTSPTPMYPLTALGAGVEPLRSLDPKRRTRVMSILNVTPDSFSDGGVHQPTDLNTLKDTILANIAAGATIIDIGGQSSRPNAEDITAEEEISRILPAIEMIKTLPEAQGIAISIDTYRAKVAEAAINAGAHIINDISAGLLDPEMLPTVARLGCTYIMMHMRGTPSTMQNEENTSYPDGLLPTIAYELLRRLDAAREAGIRRWRIILDPGIGFAKTLDQNVELLKRFGELRNWTELQTYPWLVGTSRKGFIGKITGVKDAKERVSGTAATVTAAVQGGAEIVRVHDTKEMGEVIRMADAMYRS